MYGTLLVLTLLVLSVTYILYINEKDTKLESISYDVWIDVEDSVSYQIKIPIIVDVNGTLSNMMDTIEIMDGNCSWFLETTAHGMFISINGSGNLWLKAQKNVNMDFFLTNGSHPENVDDFNFIPDTQKNEYEVGNVYVELNWTSNSSSNIQLFLNLNLGNVHHNSEQIIILGGWQEVTIRYYATIP
jgi:hypothetical protein